MPDLFQETAARYQAEKAPLADRMRPQTFEEMVGQGHLTGERTALRALIRAKELPSLILTIGQHPTQLLEDLDILILDAHLETQQLMDLVFTVGQYNLVSMVLNTMGVQLDERLPHFPEA